MRQECARIAGMTGLVLTVLPFQPRSDGWLSGRMQRGWKGVNTHSRVNE